MVPKNLINICIPLPPSPLNKGQKKCLYIILTGIPRQYYLLLKKYLKVSYKEEKHIFDFVLENIFGSSYLDYNKAFVAAFRKTSIKRIVFKYIVVCNILYWLM